MFNILFWRENIGKIWHGALLCFFDQSIPFPEYYEISPKLDQTDKINKITDFSASWAL